MPAPPGFFTYSIAAIAEDSEGHLYFTSGPQIIRWNGSRFEPFPAPPRAAGDRSPINLTTDKDGVLWACVESNLSYWENGQWQTEVQSTPGQGFLGLGRCEAGGVWTARGNLVAQRVKHEWGQTHTLPAGMTPDFAVFAEDKAGVLYMGLFTGGLVIFRKDGETVTGTEADGLSNTHIPAIMVDRDGSVWLGTGAGGAIQLIPRRFRVLHGSNPLSSENHITVLLQEPDGRVLFGTHSGRFYHTDGITESYLPELTDRYTKEPRALLRDRAGTLWCAADGKGLSYFDAQKWTPFPLASSWAHAIYEAPDGSLWIGHNGGLTVLDGSGARRKTRLRSLDGHDVHNFAAAPDGTLWIATSTGVYTSDASGSKTTFHPEVAGTNNLFHLSFEPDGTLWALTDTTLVRVQGNKRTAYGQEQGLKVSSSSSFLRDQGGNWWIGQFTGIARLDRQSLNAVAEGRNTRLPQAFYNQSDGLLGDLAWIGGYSGGLRTRDGRLWIGSRRGLVVFDPVQFPLFPIAPKVIIDSVVTERATNHIETGAKAIKLPAKTSSFSIEFYSIEPTFGDRVQYEYQTGPSTSPWIALETKESVRFPSVRPGIFPVRIRASNIDGVTSDEPASIQVEIPPAFWQRNEVEVATVALLMAFTGMTAWGVQRRRLALARNRAEAERQQAVEHARFAGILRATADLVIFTDPDQRLSFINDSGRRMLGIPGSQSATTIQLAQLLSARSWENVRQVMLNLRADNDLWRGLVDFEWHDGTPIAASVALLAHRCDDGSIDFYSLVGHDLREVLRAETANRELQEMLQLVSDSVPIRMGFLGLDMRYRWVSREVERVLKIPAGKIIGQLMQDVWGMETYEILRPRLYRAFAGELQRFEHSLPINDRLRHYEISLLPHSNRSGEIQGVLIVAVDLTELKDGSERRRALEDQLQQRRKLEALGTLAGGVAHDFNNLLSVIVGNLDLARGPHLPEETTEALDEIQKASQRAREIVRQILLFSRQQSQVRDPVDLGHVIREAVGLLRPTAPVKVKILTEIAECPAIAGDVTQIHQIVVNLTSNAIQAIHPGSGSVVLRLRLVPATDTRLRPSVAARSPLCAELSVIDDGIGMEEATLRRIFEPFFTTKPVGQGTGLGLAVVHGIVEAHDGVVTVASKPHQGTTFTVHFPLHDQTTPPAETNTPAGSMATGRGQRILLVDDELPVLNLGKTMLERLGYKVAAYPDATAAAQQFEAAPNNYDLVITDLTMPAMNGLEFANRVRMANNTIPIILASGMAAALDEDEARDNGVTRILAKPYRLTELAVNVAQMIGQPRR
jgi:signal transduction histidine kinase/CheY-like chemotaxis protein/streptogramin lyase